MNGLFAFHGVDSKTGVTMISQSVAETIAKYKKEVKVMHVSLNGRFNTEYVDQVGESIEGIKMYLDNKILSKKDLLQSCKYTNNLFMLAGVESPGQSRHYFPETANYLLDTMEDEFDIIIADTGNDLDNGLAIGALQRISERFCILTQQESMIKRYEKLEPLYNQLGLLFSIKIINQYSDQDPYRLEYIADRLNLCSDELIKVAKTGYGRQAEMDYRTLLYYKDENYKKDITQIADIILMKCNIDPIQKQRKKKWKLFI
ncbi:MAG: hypothetical protein ACOX4P_06270 [Anaerovoracaceae bacterium]|jgi:hypothetical protein